MQILGDRHAALLLRLSIENQHREILLIEGVTNAESRGGLHPFDAGRVLGSTQSDAVDDSLTPVLIVAENQDLNGFFTHGISLRMSANSTRWPHSNG